MPIFEFTCRACRARFEEILTTQALAAGEVACPQCGSAEVERALSTFATTSGGAEASSLPCGGSGAGCGGGFT